MATGPQRWSSADVVGGEKYRTAYGSAAAQRPRSDKCEPDTLNEVSKRQ